MAHPRQQQIELDAQHIVEAYGEEGLDSLKDQKSSLERSKTAQGKSGEDQLASLVIAIDTLEKRKASSQPSSPKAAEPVDPAELHKTMVQELMHGLDREGIAGLASDMRADIEKGINVDSNQAQLNAATEALGKLDKIEANIDNMPLAKAQDRLAAGEKEMAEMEAQGKEVPVVLQASVKALSRRTGTLNATQKATANIMKQGLSTEKLQEDKGKIEAKMAQLKEQGKSIPAKLAILHQAIGRAIGQTQEQVEVSVASEEVKQQMESRSKQYDKTGRPDRLFADERERLDAPVPVKPQSLGDKIKAFFRKIVEFFKKLFQEKNKDYPPKHTTVDSDQKQPTKAAKMDKGIKQGQTASAKATRSAPKAKDVAEKSGPKV